MANLQSKELFINMRKQDIPFWNPLLTYDEQDEDVKQFWQEEAKKLEKGITINGVFFHPWLYWHLNFWKMMIDDGDRRIPGNSHLRDNEWFFAEILKRAEEENKGIFMFGTRRFGKALLNSELLYTPTGEIKIGDALVGQKIYGEDGKLEEITGVYPQGAVRTYRILFEDGRNAICCGEHLWRVYSQGAWRVLSTNAIIKKNWKDMYIQTCKAVDYPQAKLPINPNTFGSMVASYLLGTTDSIYLTKQQCKKYVRSSVAQKKIFIESLIKGFKNVVTGEELLDINRTDPDVIGFVLRMFWSYGWYASYNQTTMEIFVSERIDQVAIKDIKVYGKYNATCITVDRPEGLFLTTNYLVTHNSAIMSSFLARNATMTYNLGHNVIGSSKEDLASIAEYLEFGLDNVHPFLKINRTGNNWEKEVIMGNRMITGERDVHARIKIINVEGTSKGGSSLKTAGSTPYTSIYDEVGKYPFLGAYLAGRPSHMMHGKMRGMILSAGCVCVGTKIYRGDGSVAFIEDIKLGDTVVGYKGKGDECSIERVDWVKPPSEKPCYRINFDTGDKLECSYDHPIYVYKDGNFTFVDAMYLEPGDVSLAVSIKKDSTKMYTAVVRYIEYMGYKMVYNMTTSGSHTYLANNIVTHNTGGNVERSQDAQKVMNDPAKYHFIIMDYDLLNKHTVNPTWRICKSGCFVPGQMSHAYEKKKITLAEYLDRPKSTLLKKIPIEVTDFDKNTKVIRDRLNELANGDRELYIQEKMAYPLTIDDCFLNTNVNRFPIEDAAKHKNELLENGRVGKVVDVYKLAGNKMGQNYSDKPVAPYPFKGGNIDCPVVIYEDPPEDGGNFNFTYASGCLLPGERVLTDTGLKPVETVDFSDRLVNMEGEYVEINTLLRYKKKDVDVYTLTMGNGLSKTSFTEEHPIYAASQVKRNHRTREDLFKFSFKKVSEVKETDWVRYPNLYAKEWDITPYMGMFKDLADNIDFWWIAGYYVGNGYTQAGRNVIGFALCIEETAVIERLKRIIREIFQKTPHLVLKKRKEGGKGAEINFSCMEYYTWLFTTFGKYALKKRIPEHIKHLDKDCKVSFLQGYLDSDGHLSVHTKGYFGMEYVSANLPLLEDIQDMFLSIGMPGNITKLRDSGTAVILGVVSRQKACYHLRIGDNHTNEFCEWAKRLYPDGSRKINKATGLVSRGKRHKKDCFISEDRRYIYFQIKKIEKSKYTGMVCNFDCETHTYLCHHITTHNCDPYKAEKADTDSLGAFYIFKRAVNINDPYGNRIVASYAARPASSDDFCRTCETLIEAYGAKCLMENADRIFELYLARQGKDQYLLEDGEALANRIIRPGARQNNRLGLAPTPINQRMLFSAVLQYCWEEVVVDVDQFGNEITQLGIYRIDDVELLEEIIAFGHGVNTDRIIAFGHALLLARYYDDMNYMPESSTAKKNAQIRDMLKCRQAIGFASNPANKGFVSRSSILNR